jgi:hypothetical protein
MLPLLAFAHLFTHMPTLQRACAVGVALAAVWCAEGAHSTSVSDRVTTNTATHSAAPPLPPVKVSADGRFATVAPGTSAVPIGLYAMIYATYPPAGTHGSQFLPMTASDWESVARRGEVAAISLQVSAVASLA